MSAKKSVDNLFSLKNDQVKKLVHTTFIKQIEYSKSVHGIFFGSAGKPAVDPVNKGWVDDIAVALVCSAMSHSSLHKFGKTVSRSRADNYWQSRLTDHCNEAVKESQALYKWAFPSHCRNKGVTFQAYLHDNPKKWGKALAEKVKEPSFINVEVNKIIDADPNWSHTLNLTFYKLHRLDSTLVQDVVDTWSKAYPDKAITQCWDKFNFIPHNLFTSDKYIAQVNAAISVKKVDMYTPPAEGEAIPQTMETDTWGIAVAKFLKGRPKHLGLTTGKSPDNKRISTAASHSCFVAGTPLTLYDGKEIPIEEVREGDKVLARGGTLSVHSNERVIVPVEHEITILGFNEFAPFFSPGHLFMTPDGWKAYNPSIGLEENPDRQIGKLKQGDIVFRIGSHTPFSYEEVKIEKFTSAQLSPGDFLYGLHLYHSRSYHAHGFCVGMNYPVITEQRLTDGFERLTAAERKAVSDALNPVIPMLDRAMGSFIVTPFKKALT